MEKRDERKTKIFLLCFAVFMGLMLIALIVTAIFGAEAYNEWVKAYKEAQQPSITVISPNGGEKWVWGNTYNITWRQTRLDKVDIQLEKWAGDNGQIYAGGPLTLTIAEVSASVGQYSWRVSDLAAADVVSPGNYYKIRIVKTGDASPYSQQIADSSDNYFSIVSPTPSIAVISPNGGEKWTIGNTYTIRWNTSGYGSNASIQIGLRDARYDPNLAAGEMTIVDTTNTGSYNWTVPSTFEGRALGGSGYKIVVYIEGGGPGKCDLSNDDFSIVGTELGQNKD